MLKEISPQEFIELPKDSYYLLDVRELEEYDFINIGGIHIPMGDIPSRLTEIPDDKPIITICHHGIRSARVAMFLLEQGFSDISNLKGGIDKYTTDLDTSLPRY